MKVACILDTFSYECFKYECRLEQLRLDSWKEQMERITPEFLFVESAWKGVDETWVHQLTNVKGGPGKDIKDLILYCKEKRIKTVFWNKEDDVNYQYFIDTAKLFDYIFTTDKNCIERYIQDVGHENVYSLLFAAQPAIHNPINTSFDQKENIAFAGAWYAKKHPERRDDMLTILRPAKKFGLNIFDRMHTFSTNQNYQYPEEFQNYIIGELDYQEMVKAYKKYKIFLNVNSVKNSPTMFSRRVFELLACGTNVLSTYSKGIEEMFKGIVPTTFSEEDTEIHLSVLLNNQEYSNRLNILGLREIHSKHLYKHRFNYILETIGLKQTADEMDGVSVITYCKNNHLMKQIFENYERQIWPNKELILILNRYDMDVRAWEMRAEVGQNISVYILPEGKTHEDGLNFAIDKSKYNFISIFGECDYYAPFFLTDLMNSFEYTDSEIVGKLSYFCYLNRLKALVLRFPEHEHRFVPFLSGSAMIMKKEVFDQVRFREGDSGFDTKFVRDCVEKGMKLFSCDKYNHVRIIASKEEEYQFLQKSRIIAYTEDYKTHVTV
jgi:spore maturation protein CgeB